MASALRRHPHAEPRAWQPSEASAGDGLHPRAIPDQSRDDESASLLDCTLEQVRDADFG
jgi:hypothetical protein